MNEWIEKIEKIDMFKMNQIRDDDKKEHARKIEHWYTKVLEQDVPEIYRRYIERNLKKKEKK